MDLTSGFVGYKINVIRDIMKKGIEFNGYAYQIEMKFKAHVLNYKLYEIPIIFLIGWRGFLKDDAPEHEKIGKIQPDLLKNLNLENRILDEKTWEKKCKWALSKIKKNIPVALIIRREFLD